tara:strand:- start:12828 stop:13973 length:1146 start_codon:yes stop_codon:yes gene_type:complete
MNGLIDTSYYIICFLFLGKFFFDKKTYKITKVNRFFTKPIVFLYITLVFSAISCFYYHGQNPLKTLLGMRYFSYFMIYFMLISFGVQKKDIIKLLHVAAVIYMLVFLTQVYLYPTQIVPFDSSASISRGFLRLRLEGVGFVTLLGFYSLNKFLINPKRKISIVLFLLCFTFVFILGFRTLLLTYLFSAGLLVLLHNMTIVNVLKLIFVTAISFLLLWQLPIVKDFVIDAIVQTLEQSEEGDEYIRLLAFNFLFIDVNVNFGSLFFGNGFPIRGTSYGNLVLVKGADVNGYISADLGLIGFVFNYGLLSLFALLNVFRIAIFKNKSKESIYVGVFFVYLVVSSISTSEVYRIGMFGVEMIALYLFSLHSFEAEQENIEIADI